MARSNGGGAPEGGGGGGRGGRGFRGGFGRGRGRGGGGFYASASRVKATTGGGMQTGPANTKALNPLNQYYSDKFFKLKRDADMRGMKNQAFCYKRVINALAKYPMPVLCVE